MNRQTNNFGFGQTGRSGIRPPTSYGMQSSGQSRPRVGSSSSISVPSTASSRKGQNNTNVFNFPGSGNSRTSRQGLTNSAMGSRQSMFGNNNRANPFSSARKSVTAKLGPLFGQTPQHNRQSFNQNSASAQSNRRSSIGGARHVKDSRNLSDPHYQKQCVAKLIAFLTENPIAVYPHQISKTLASRPTVADITRIFEFLFSCFGIKSKVTPMEVEIPKAMECLEYPYPVKKSDLVSFTSGRSLGSVLGMLEWLVNSLMYGYNMDPIRTFYPNFEGEVDIKTELVKLCLKPDLDSEQIDVHIQELIHKTYGTEDDIEQLLEEQEALEAEVQRLDEEIQGIQDLPNTVQTYKSDIKNFDQYMTEMGSHFKTTKDTLESLEKDIEERMATIKKLEEQKKQIKTMVEKQQFGIEEAFLAKERKQQLEDAIKEEESVVDGYKKSIRSLRLEYSKFENDIKKMNFDLDSFITAMTDIVDSPVMSNYSSSLRQLLSNNDWKNILEMFKDISGKTNGSDVNKLEKLLSNKVRELKIAIVQQLSSLQGSVSLSEQQKLKELDLLIDDFENKLKQFETQINKSVTESEQTRKEQVSQISSLQSECDQNRQLLSELEANSKRSQKEEKQNLLELRKQVEEKEIFVKQEKEVMFKQLNDNINANKKGMNQFNEQLDQSIANEKAKNIQLKAISAKLGGGDPVDTNIEKKGREKRTKKDKKK